MKSPAMVSSKSKLIIILSPLLECIRRIKYQVGFGFSFF